MNSEIQETIAEIRARIHVLKPILSRVEGDPENKESLAEMLALVDELLPWLKKLEEHINILEKKND